MGRSRRELSNAYLLAKFGFDTAENEPSKICRIRTGTRWRPRGGAPVGVRRVRNRRRGSSRCDALKRGHLALCN